MTSRVGQIRDIIVEAGGNPNFVYYCDGPRSMAGDSRGADRVTYKIEATSDGLSRDAREQLLRKLAELPDAEGAYITQPRRVWSTLRGFHVGGQHLKVVFKNRAR